MWYPGFIAQYNKSSKEQQGLLLSNINPKTLEKKKETRKQSGKKKHKG